MKKVLIPTKLNKVASELLIQAGYDVIQDSETPLTELVKEHADTFGMIVRSEKIPAAIIEALPELKVIVRAGAGFDTIDIRFARKAGVDVMNTPGANANGVAEEVIAMMLADARQIVSADTSTRAGLWEKKKLLGREITGKTVGIIGLGNIGRLVAKRLKGFECTIMGFDPMLTSDRIKSLGIAPADVASIFATCDYVTLHIPGGESTKGFVSAELLKSMKPGATIINCARHGIIDEEALRQIKADKGLRFLNDVYAKDEAGEKPMADIADLMLPHLGANTQEANLTAARRAAEELIDLDQKGQTAFIVNRDIPEGLDRNYCDLAYEIAALAHRLAGKDRPIKMIESTTYGQLAPFAKWLVVPQIAGIYEEFDRSNDQKSALTYLKDAGINYESLTEEDSPYHNSIQVSVVVEQADKTLKRVTVRGTTTEGVRMVSSIDEFDQLYFQPSGPTLFFVYQDRPGVIAAIARALATREINIEDMRNPHHMGSSRSLAILRVSRAPSCEVVEAIAKTIEADSAVCLSL